MTEPEMTETERHKARMARKKAIVDEKVKKADQSRGVVIVLTGAGKGKSSSAFGMVARALGHDMKVGIVQFIKGKFATGEEAFFRRFPEVEYHVMGEGFTWETQDRERDEEAARAAWDIARQQLANPQLAMVVLDELNIVLKYKYLSVDEVIAALTDRPEHQHVIITGRNAPPDLIEVADTVTDSKLIKHAFKAGVKAQKGIEL
ncbi:cob(I)alamin adenosyltransferase [Methylohalomonas lacus]|uniref:Corrinoid adenosyltransferase n=1 Tax=Methylohalomonas lacus TaxID=398773 RepID=A0AAE3HLN1_9GAMM|nr:cob(I)yrinic acid a,c-diamide adenosyltransferase [Methylohalomonas lacus]MCS3902687.1 cob(I)alamin adenosyltransferase [Methylohalomonas lacus]